VLQTQKGEMNDLEDPQDRRNRVGMRDQLLRQR